ncbi:hypothetical protein [Bacillus coahuilensis]|uniref:hypothetical protein n=1 Tax=Bacillus coahuilensis TaxID=408580 RepID=UPI00187CAAA3|nr:hypothetical protein [Bacillus coahuilensis]
MYRYRIIARKANGSPFEMDSKRWKCKETAELRMGILQTIYKGIKLEVDEI